jgi:hypothetical protein
LLAAHCQAEETQFCFRLGKVTARLSPPSFSLAVAELTEEMDNLVTLSEVTEVSEVD